MSRFSNLEIASGRMTHAQESALRSDPSRDDKHYIEQADKAFRGARFELAMRYYSRALEFNPNRQDAWNGQARSLLELGELPEARVWSKKALELFKDNNDLLSSLAVATMRLGDRDKAMAFSDAAINQKSPTPWVWSARGEIMLAIGSSMDVFCFDKAREVARGDWFTLLSIARAYRYYRNPARGLHFAREAQSLQPDSAFAAYVVGDCSQALGHTAQARSAYELSQRLDIEFPLAHPALVALGRQSWLDRFLSLFRRLRNRP